MTGGSTDGKADEAPEAPSDPAPEAPSDPAPEAPSDPAPAARGVRAGTSGGLRRVALVIVLGAVLVGAGVADRLVGRAAPAVAPSAGALSDVAVTPVRGTESAAWFCAGGTGAGGGAPATIIVTNASRHHALVGTLTAVTALAPGASPPAPWSGAQSVEVRVPPAGEVAVGAGQLGGPGAVAAAVVLDGGGGAVSEAVSSPLGWTMSPCASSTAPDWYFAHGATFQGSGLTLSLFNPGSTDATVDVSLVSPTSGYVSPAAYQGIGVPPGALVTENVGDHAAQDPDLATEVSTVSGSVVATELESVGSVGDGGLSLTLGSPVPAPTWVFPENIDVPGNTVAFHLLNPSSRPAPVSVVIGLSAGATAEPLSMTVAPQSLATFTAEDQTRIPAGVHYAVRFVSRGPGIVVSREVAAAPGQPAPVPEVGEVTGVPGGRTRWVVPAVAAPGVGAWAVGLVDLGAAPASVQVLLTDGRRVPGGSMTLRPGVAQLLGPGLGPPYGTTPLQIVSTEPVAIEIDAEPVAAPGVVAVPTLAG